MKIRSTRPSGRMGLTVFDGVISTEYSYSDREVATDGNMDQVHYQEIQGRLQVTGKVR